MNFQVDNKISSSFECNIMTWEKDQDSIYRDANPNFLETMGFEYSSFISKFTDFDIPCRLAEFATTFREHDLMVMKSGKPLRLLEIQPCAHDKWLTLLVTKSPLYNDTNEIIGTRGQAIDITILFKSIPDLFPIIYKNATKQPIFQNVAVDLTGRQSECLFHLLRGKTSSETAKALNLSRRTVESHIEILKQKFNCSSKSELVEKCIDRGLLSFIPESLLHTQSSFIINE